MQPEPSKYLRNGGMTLSMEEQALHQACNEVPEGGLVSVNSADLLLKAQTLLSGRHVLTVCRPHQKVPALWRNNG